MKSNAVNVKTRLDREADSILPEVLTAMNAVSFRFRDSLRRVWEGLGRMESLMATHRSPNTLREVEDELLKRAKILCCATEIMDIAERDFWNLNRRLAALLGECRGEASPFTCHLKEYRNRLEAEDGLESVESDLMQGQPEGSRGDVVLRSHYPGRNLVFDLIDRSGTFASVLSTYREAGGYLTPEGAPTRGEDRSETLWEHFRSEQMLHDSQGD